MSNIILTRHLNVKLGYISYLNLKLDVYSILNVNFFFMCDISNLSLHTEMLKVAFNGHLNVSSWQH